MAVDGFELSELADVAIVEDILLCCYAIMVTQLTLEDNDKTSSSIVAFTKSDYNFHFLNIVQDLHQN
ncbi:hypothetical protein BLOT_004798 [Blomia tropicalis]|nr:hypothetical protein BLOT_004798 [Blomia tropicalis]